jgi:hypothetical protein
MVGSATAMARRTMSDLGSDIPWAQGLAVLRFKVDFKLHCNFHTYSTENDPPIGVPSGALPGTNLHPASLISAV